MIGTPFFVLCRNEATHPYVLPVKVAFIVGQCRILSMIDTPVLSST